MQEKIKIKLSKEVVSGELVINDIELRQPNIGDLEQMLKKADNQEPTGIEITLRAINILSDNAIPLTIARKINNPKDWNKLSEVIGDFLDPWLSQSKEESELTT